jgi:hypothetical protein
MSRIRIRVRSASRVFALILVFASLNTWALVATEQSPYYGETFVGQTHSGLRDQALIESIRTVLVSPHSRRANQPDLIGPCDSSARECYTQTSIGYSAARTVLLGKLHLSGTAPNYSIKDVYCQKDYTAADFRGTAPGPGITPDESVLNVEHTWPQSRFNHRMQKEVQKSDLHHLFPADSKMNSIRGNMTFGDVDHPVAGLPCSESRMGTSTDGGGNHFEPPATHRGNVARALFYFSIRYQIHIDPKEEAILKRWNHEDPVDIAEMERNDQIMVIQGNRNPFIDYPELADSISDF